jgi:hypothetical protein
MGISLASRVLFGAAFKPGSGGGGVADAFGVQEAPTGGVADLGQGGEVSQLFADAEVAAG